MHYVVSPTSEEDFNWIDWWVIGHEDKELLGQSLSKLCKDYYEENYIDEEDPNWVDDDGESFRLSLKQYLESLGYFVCVANLQWLEGIYNA